LDCRERDPVAAPPLEEGDNRTGLGREIVSLHEAHSATLLSYARALTPNSPAASDAVQETFLRYWIVRRTGDQIDNPKAWLFRVLHNLLLDWRKQAAAAVEIDASAVLAKRDDRPDPEMAYGQAELLRRLERMLSPREQECLRLRIAGLHYREIAHVLGVQLGTVSALLARIQKKTRDLGLAGRYVLSSDEAAQ
jgi:RNA polymerase sigma-70 factor (ECF subfamily)